MNFVLERFVGRIREKFLKFDPKRNPKRRQAPRALSISRGGHGSGREYSLVQRLQSHGDVQHFVLLHRRQTFPKMLRGGYLNRSLPQFAGLTEKVSHIQLIRVLPTHDLQS